MLEGTTSSLCKSGITEKILNTTIFSLCFNKKLTSSANFRSTLCHLPFQTQPCTTQRWLHPSKHLTHHQVSAILTSLTLIIHLSVNKICGNTQRHWSEHLAVIMNAPTQHANYQGFNLLMSLCCFLIPINEKQLRFIIICLLPCFICILQTDLSRF